MFTPPFLLLAAAAALFRVLSSDARRSFDLRLVNLLPRKVLEDRLRVLASDYPELGGQFWRRVAPFFALHVFFNVAACGCFSAALWFFLPGGMEYWDAIFVRYGALILVPLAFCVDTMEFVKMWMAAAGRGQGAAEI